MNGGSYEDLHQDQENLLKTIKIRREALIKRLKLESDVLNKNYKSQKEKNKSNNKIASKRKLNIIPTQNLNFKKVKTITINSEIMPKLIKHPKITLKTTEKFTTPSSNKVQINSNSSSTTNRYILFKNQLIENQKEIKELKINLKNKLEEREKLKKLIKKVKIR